MLLGMKNPDPEVGIRNRGLQLFSGPDCCHKNCSQPKFSKNKRVLLWGIRYEEKFKTNNKILFSFFDGKNPKPLDLMLCCNELM